MIGLTAWVSKLNTFFQNTYDGDKRFSYPFTQWFIGFSEYVPYFYFFFVEFFLFVKYGDSVVDAILERVFNVIS